MFGPTPGASSRRRAGRQRTGPIPSSANSRRSWSSTTSGNAPTTSEFARRRSRQDRHHRREAGVLALGEGGLDAAARIVQHPHVRRVPRAQPLGGAGEVELDHLRRAGADQEQLADVGAPRQQPRDLAVDLLLRVGEPGEVLLLHDRRAESRLGEDHHARRRLQKMRAGAGAHDEEERVLHLAVQPDDPGQAAEHLALAALAQDGGVEAAPGGRYAGGQRHAGAPADSSRAARSFSRNCVALIA